MASKAETKDTAKKVEGAAKTAMNKAKDYLSTAGSKIKEGAEEAGAMTKANVEAVVESGKIATKGSSEIAKDNVEFAKSSFEGYTSAAKEIAAVKTPNEFFKMQGDYMRKSFDDGMSQFSKNSEAMIKLMGESFAPVSNRMSVVAEKFQAA